MPLSRPPIRDSTVLAGLLINSVLAQVLPEVQNAACTRDSELSVVAQDQMTVHKKDTPMLRVSLSIILLAGWTVAIPVARSAADDEMKTLTIEGSITYEAGAALPAGSRAVIELRHLPALPDAPSVADRRIDLEREESPVPFEFTVERYKLVGGTKYFVRGAIVS